ncbi:MAG TPA: phosphate ABC transporter permease subunit PstC [Clostridiaceae bacterium]|nr:phosphate ABC transporter permease subunit PstC [Clostridiaceae bacterium]
MLTSNISVHGQILSYPGISKIFAIITLVLIAVAIVGTWIKKYTIATISSVASVITYLATGTTLGNIVNPALAAAGIEPSVSVKYLTYQASYYLQIILLILLGVLIYWLSGGEQLAQRLFLIAATISIASVLVITIYMLIIGLPAMIEIGPLKFLFGTVWDPTNSTLPQFGILPMILTSVFCTILSVVIGVPVGILTAVFLAEIAPKWVVNIVHPAVELLAGIPSVIYGFFALQILSPFVKRVFDLPSGDTMLTATIVLAIMILPTIITTCESGLNAVPDLYREASLAMGASQIRTIFKIVIPAARSAILSGVILGVGRSIGETMAIIMVAGNSPQMPNLLGSVRPMTVGIVMEMSYATGLHRDSLFSIGLVLFVFIMIVNFLFTWISKKGVQLDGKNE